MPTPLASARLLRPLIAAAAAAPSIHNTQPWQFAVAADGLLELHGDLDRMLWVADPRGRALHLSCGAALFNLRLALRATGHRPVVWLLPSPMVQPTLLALVRPEPGRPATATERKLIGAIERRHTNRAPFSGRTIPESVQTALEQAAAAEFATLYLLDAHDTSIAVQIAAAATASLAVRPDHRAELRQWTGAGQEDGIPAAALALRPLHEPAPVRDFGYVLPAMERPVASYERLPQLAVLLTTRDEPGDWLRAGQALQRVLLTATAHGLSASFLYHPIELDDMGAAPGPWWPRAGNPQIIIRFGYGGTAPPSPRRPLAGILAGMPDQED